MKTLVLYVGSSLLAPLKHAEREINRAYKLDLEVATYNFGAPLSDDEWQNVERDLSTANIVFVIHVMDGENASRLVAALGKQQLDAVIVINCMPELMRLTRMGRLDVEKLSARNGSGKGTNLLSAVGSWVGQQAQKHRQGKKKDHSRYLKLADRLPGILKFVPTAGALSDVKHYLYLFCYFLQPTPTNIESMLLYALKHYSLDSRLKRLRVSQPEQVPSVAIYHPDAPKLFESFDEYREWSRSEFSPEATVGLLLMRPQVVSQTTKHYDALIRAIEAEGLAVIPAIATLMDNREAVSKFFLNRRDAEGAESRVSQILSLTGFSFVGGPAMNDSAAATEFLKTLNTPYRSAVSLDTQSIESWSNSQIGLNPIQAGMQIAIPEIDGATEPFVYGGLQGKGQEPVALTDRCERIARRLKRWNNLRTLARSEVKLALVLFCFPPNKGNIGTAADLDVFPSVYDLLINLKADGYEIELPESVDALRARLLNGNSERFGAPANVHYRMKTDEYRRLCPYVKEIEAQWGPAPGSINSFGGDLLIQGIQFGKVLLAVQPTFGFEGDPMRMMMARSSSPHHGFMAFYTYLSRVFAADAVIHFGTHGALEFMPGKQVGLSGECWPDRLIGELPNFYVYSVNNPSEGSIAKRRSYAELISYLTPPIENAGLYKDLAGLKELVTAYRQSNNEAEREQLFESIANLSKQLNLSDTRTNLSASPR